MPLPYFNNILIVIYKLMSNIYAWCFGQWLLTICYGQTPGTMGLSNIGLGLYLDG